MSYLGEPDAMFVLSWCFIKIKRLSHFWSWSKLWPRGTVSTDSNLSICLRSNMHGTWWFITFLSCGNQSFTIKLLANYFRLLHNNWRSLKIVHRRICIITGQNCYRQPLHCPRHRRLGKRAWMNVWTRAGERLKRGCRKNRGQGFALSHRSLILLCCLWISFITIHQPKFWYQAPIGVVW